MAFQRFRPTFQKLFLKKNFFDSFNGLYCLRVALHGLCLDQKKLAASLSPVPLTCAGSADRTGKNA
jgi:hypothetical protein